MWCVETGGRRGEFWAATLREIAFDLEVASARTERDEQSRRFHTWHIAALPNLKKFPSFDEFVKPAPVALAVKQKQTVEQQISIARQWTAATKGRR